MHLLQPVFSNLITRPPSEIYFITFYILHVKRADFTSSIIFSFHDLYFLVSALIKAIFCIPSGLSWPLFFCLSLSKLGFCLCTFQQIMSLGDQNLDGHMSFEEFVKYVTDHQKKLWIVFKTIDQDDSGELSFVSL